MKVGVLLSGCGVQDGSEIYEAVLTLLALDRAGVQIIATAPDIEQAHVVDHYNGSETRMETRSVLAEAARIVRGKITSLNEISAHDLDALIIVGGYGAAKNLSTYAFDDINASVDSNVARIIGEMHGLGKPIGAMCIAPVVVALALRDLENAAAPTLTIGRDASVALALTRWGAHHRETKVDEICIDAPNKIVSTAAFMLAESPAQAEPGITKLVNQVLSLVQENTPGYRGAPAVSQTVSA